MFLLNHKKSKLFLDISIAIVICLIIGFTILLFHQKKSYETAAMQYETEKLNAVCDTGSDGSADRRSIDFSYLDDKNHVISSWIYIPGTNIDYPVVQGIDNTIYLNYDAYGNESSYGAIFIDCNNAPDFSDYKTILYGHSMKDGSMFHQLHDFSSDEFAKDHPELYFYLPDDNIIKYHLLCTLKTDAYNETIYLDQSIDSLNYMLKNADHVYDEDNQQKIVLLSTCIRGNRRRVVVFQQNLS